MKSRELILIVLLLFPARFIYCQREPMYSQYFFNNSVVNPAQAGGSGSNMAGMLVRDQWIGIDGAPRTLSAYTNLRLPRQLGLALGLYQDRVGPEVNTSFQADLAYHAKLTEKWTLSAGVRFSVTYIRVGLSRVPNIDPRNPLFTNDISSGLRLNTGAGLLAYTNRTYLGVALPQAFKNMMVVYEPDAAVFENKEFRSLAIYGGSDFKLSGEFSLLPSAMIRIGSVAPDLDINTVFSYRKIVDFGPLLRADITDMDELLNSLGFLIGINYRQRWYLGYVYELPLNELHAAFLQTHEVSLRFFWGNRKGPFIRSPRYFL